LRTCRGCGAEFEPTDPAQRYCPLHSDAAPSVEPHSLEGGPGLGHQPMRKRDFPEQTYLDVRLRIQSHNIQPSGDLYERRVRAVTEAAEAADALALRGALTDLAAIAVQIAGHKEVLAVMGIRPPVVPTRRGDT
jgi:hypothetical protein